MQIRFLCALFLVLGVAPAIAQTSPAVEGGNRFKPLKFDELSEKQKQFVIYRGAARKPSPAVDVTPSTTSSLTYSLIRSPDLAEHELKAGAYLREAVPRKLYEIAILMAARHWNSQYIWWSHTTKYVKENGVSQEIVDGIATGQRPKSMQPDEEAVYDFITELLEKKEISDKAFAALLQQLGSERAVVDLIAVVGHYSSNAMYLMVDRFPLPNGAEPALKPLRRDVRNENAIGHATTEPNPALGSVVAPGADAQVVYRADKETLFEGPQWIRDGNSGFLIFNTRPGNAIQKLQPDGALATFLPDIFTGKPAEGKPTWNAAGTTLDRERRVVYCASSAGAVVRLEKDGRRTTLADRFDGKRLNAPNDLVYRSDGSLYFTDGGASVKWDDGEGVPHRGLYMVRRGKIRLLSKDFDRPNGLAFSPDQKQLYVADTPKKVIYRFDVHRDGSVSNQKVFIDVSADSQVGNLDGLKVDERGNVYATGPGGIWVISPEAKHLGTIAVPGGATNLAFGGDDRKMLYITGRSFVARLPVQIAGIQP